MKGFFRFFAARHLIAYLFTIMAILLGTAALVQMRRDVFPQVETGEAIITTRYPGASPEDVELNVTNRIEDELRSVSDLAEIESYSMDSISVVHVSADINAPDKERIIDDVREALTRVTDLPPSITEAPLVTEFNTEEFPVLEVGLAGNIPYAQLREAARLFRKKLENIPGVARVDDLWFLDREVKIEVSPERLKAGQVSLLEIVAAIRQRSIRATAGFTESYDNSKAVVVEAEYAQPLNVSSVTVRTTFGGPALRVGDLAEVTEGFAEPRTMSRINGIPAITFRVIKQGTADVIRTVDAIKDMAAGERKLLPDGVNILYANDISEYIRRRFGVVLSNGAIGFFLVVVLLTVFLNLSTSFWVALSIPVALLGAIFLLSLTGVYLEIISLTAMIIVLGIIVDDGIIVSENIIRKREEGMEPLEAAVEGLAEVFQPVMANLLTSMLAFAPLLFMSGITGDFIKVIPTVVILALLVSAVEIVVALPAHLKPGLARLRRGDSGDRHWFNAVRDWFCVRVRVAVRHRYLALLLAAILLAGTLSYAFLFMRFQLFPGTTADTFFVYVETPDGSSLEKTADMITQIEKLVASLPEGEVRSFSTTIGNHGDQQPGESPRWAFIRVDLPPYSRKRRTADEIVEELRRKTAHLAGFKDIDYEVQAGGPPVGKPVTIRIVGGSDRQRRSLTDAVVKYLGSLEGVTGINRNDETTDEQLRVSADYARLARLGLTVQDLSGALRTALEGEIAASVRYGDEDVDFRVILQKEARAESGALSELLVPNAQGRLISFRQVAKFSRGRTQSMYYHFDRERAANVTADVTEGVTTPVEVTNRVTRHFNLARDWPEMRFVVGGEAQETTEEFRSLYIAFAVAVVAIYFLLMLLFNSVAQPLIVMVAIPFGIIAVIAAFALHGLTLGFLAMIGLVGLTGVVVNDSIVMISHINDLRRRDPALPVIELVATGSADRLRAVTMTTLTTVAGLLPLAYGIGGADPFVAPLALALGYGVLFSTPFTLVIVPCVYAAGIDLSGFMKRIFKRG